MATEYISREAAIEALCKAHSPYPRRREISVRAIQDISPADVRLVVKASWILPNADGTDRPMAECSNCGWYVTSGGVRDFTFCPNCGADMRKVVEIDQVKEGTK